MLQKKVPEDFVIATGRKYTFRQCITSAASYSRISIEFFGESFEEIDRVISRYRKLSPFLSSGEMVFTVNKNFYRPLEVETPVGYATKAKNRPRWQEKTNEKCSLKKGSNRYV